MNIAPVDVDRTLAGVAHVVLQAPERRNPINHVVLDALETALFDGRTEAAVLSAVPGPVFSAGGDLGLEPAELERVSDRIYTLCQRLSKSTTVLVGRSEQAGRRGGAHLFLTATCASPGPAFRFRPAIPDAARGGHVRCFPSCRPRPRSIFS